MDEATRALLVKALHDAANAIADGAEVVHYGLGGQTYAGDSNVTVAFRTDPPAPPEAPAEPEA